MKKAPVPTLAKTHMQGVEQLVADVSRRDQPRLVICYDRIGGQVLYEKFLQENPGKKIVYVPIHPTSEEVGEYCRSLAEGNTDILISAGNLGFGVNIVKRNGEFPDLHVSLFGLPENQLQVVQAFGRRRKTGSDLSWYVSEPDIYRYIADFKSETSWRERFIQGYLSVEQLLAGYEEVGRQPAKGLVFVADLLRQHESVRRADDGFVTFFDQAMDRIRNYGFTRMERLIRESNEAAPFPQRATGLGRVLSSLESRSADLVKAKLNGSIEAKRRSQWILGHIKEVAAQYGLPDELDDDMRHELDVAAGALQAQNMKDLVETKFITHLFNRVGVSQCRIDRYVDDWFQSRQEGMEEVIRLLSDNYRLERMFPFVFRRARDELARAASITPTPEMDANLARIFQPLPVTSATLPSGMDLGVFRLGDFNLLGCRQGSELLLLNSYQTDKNGFDWEIGRLADQVEIMPIRSPIGNGSRSNDNVFFLWTSKA